MNAFHGFILSYFTEKTGDPDAAKDLFQVFWIAVYKNFRVDQYRSPALLKFKAYQVWASYARKQRPRQHVTYPGHLPDLAAEPEPIDMPLEQEAEFKRDFWNQHFPKMKLDEAHKEAFWLKEFHGFKLEQISVRLNVPVSTVDEWIRKLKRRCCEYLKGAAK